MTAAILISPISSGISGHSPELRRLRTWTIHFRSTRFFCNNQRRSDSYNFRRHGSNRFGENLTFYEAIPLFCDGDLTLFVFLSPCLQERETGGRFNYFGSEKGDRSQQCSLF